VDSVEETKLADSDFTIPSDYIELSPTALQNEDKGDDFQ
jgi:hypothetical protein